jgi:hypothetical protein
MDGVFGWFGCGTGAFGFACGWFGVGGFLGASVSLVGGHLWFRKMVKGKFCEVWENLECLWFDGGLGW